MSENDNPARELAELEAKVRGDPLTREEEAHILSQEQRWVAESHIGDEATAGFRYWPKWLIPTLMVCFFILVSMTGCGSVCGRDDPPTGPSSGAPSGCLAKEG